MPEFDDSNISDDRLTTVARHLDHDDRETVVFRPPAPSEPLALDTRFATPPPPPAPAVPPGETGTYRPNSYVLRGKYRIDAPLKGGAQALAFRGSRTLDGAPVFIKIQHNPTGRADAFAKQILVRDKILAIHHPNLLRCFDFDLDGTALCEVYEWLEGRELSSYFLDPANRFDDATTREMVEQLSNAIRELHTATNLTHRDLKPDNIRVVEKNSNKRFVIVDYGVVSQLDSGGVTTIAGTRMYSPPEFNVRRIQNDDLLRSWDWWSLGRILQESLDGEHPRDRLPKLFPSFLPPGQDGMASSAVVEAIFDAIMTGMDYQKFRLHAGMVELSEKNSRNTKWLPLLRGLLTSNRRSRWGASEVERFLAGKHVQDFYGMASDLEGFEFEGQPWALPELAAKLATDSAADTDQGVARWNETQDLIYRGSIPRYIDGVLRDSDLARQVKACQDLKDRDLGTAVALSVISGGTVPPAIRGVQINARYLFQQAERTDRGRESRVSTLLSREFLALMTSVAPQEAEALAEQADQIRGLREHFRKLGGKGTNDLQNMLRLLRTPDQEIVHAIQAEYRPLVNRTSNPKLQELFAAPQLSSLTPFDLRALFWSLQAAGDNQYVTHEGLAEALRDDAYILRGALALKQAAKYVTWLFWPFNGSFRRLFGISAVLAILFISLASLAYARENAMFYLFEVQVTRILGAGFCFGILYGLLKIGLNRSLRKVLSEFVELNPKGQLNSTQLVNAAHDRGGDVNYGQRLKELNAEISALPHIDPAKYHVPPASFLPVNRFIWMQVGMFLILFFGARLYRPLFVELTPRPAPVEQKAPAQKTLKTPGTKRGR